MIDQVRSIFENALEDMSPGRLVESNLELSGNTAIVAGRDIPLGEQEGIYLLATGKASLEMAESGASVLGNRLSGGLVVSPYDHARYRGSLPLYRASHPVPDESSVRAGEAVVRLLEGLQGRNLLINCISGGTSSVLTLPAGDIGVEDLNRTFELLNNSGLTIREINTVRKHLSKIKGGQLLRHLDSATVLADLLLSDVPDDDPAIIGSGPTTPDVSTFQDAYHILLEQELWNRLPESVQSHIEKGIDGLVPETVKPGDSTVREHYSYIIGSAKKLAEEVADRFRREGYRTWVADDAYNDDVQAVAEMIAEMAVSVVEREGPVGPPAALVFYGESTVRVKGGGKGGRNQELALWGAIEIAGRTNITWLSAGTDGIDGPTDAAGAIVDGNTLEKAERLDLEYREFLEENDTYHFHQKAGTLLKTGSTGNNLMDIQVIVID